MLISCLIFSKAWQPLYQCHTNLQLWTFAYVQLLNKPYENEVTLTRQKLPLKCCQPLETLRHLIKGLDLSMLEIRGL